jgi:hypothetical protein
VNRRPRRVNSNVNQDAQRGRTREADVYHPIPGWVTNARFAPGTLAPPRVGGVRRFASSPSAEDTQEACACAYAYRQAVEANPLDNSNRKGLTAGLPILFSGIGDELHSEPHQVSVNNGLQCRFTRRKTPFFALCGIFLDQSRIPYGIVTLA